MTPKQILRSKRIPLSSSVLYLDADEAIENLIEVLKELDVDFDLSKLSKKEMEILFDNYADCLFNFSSRKLSSRAWCILAKQRNSNKTWHERRRNFLTL